MIWKLLRKNISVGQILGYALANLIGLAIVLSAIRFHGDVSTAINGSDESKSLIPEDYIVISKPVSMFNTLGATSSGFSDSEIDNIKELPWVRDVGAFSAADFNVSASIDFSGKGMSTFLFMESIPDSFVDAKNERWRFDPANGNADEVPIIISKDYLALYNFGFATSRGLPQLSESLISKVPIILNLSGNGYNDTFRGRIVGFSSRLNTIAVPESFLSWANTRYSDKKPDAPSRLIIKVSNPGDPAISKYMSDRGYEVAGDKADTGRASFFLTLLTSIIIAIGAIISALALFILMLSIFLLLQKNRQIISDLLLLGYSPTQVSATYCKLIGIINACVLVTAVGTMFLASEYWESRLAVIDLVPSSPLPAIVAGIVIIAVITAINIFAISRSIKGCFRQ